MIATDLYKQLSPFSLLCNKNGLSPAYRALALTSGGVLGCSTFGVMECAAALGNLGSAPLLVDAESFLQVLRSLPANELELQVSNGVLYWKCGNARGQMGLLTEKVEMPALNFDSIEGVEVSDDFGKSLEAGACACGSTAYLSVGMYGALIDNSSGDMAVYATDDVTISRCILGAALEGQGAEQVVLSPPAIELLVALAKRSKLTIAFTATSVFCESSDTQLVLKQIAPLKHDIRKFASAFEMEEVVLPLDRNIIASFIRRAEALTEDRNKSRVSISVIDGATKLEFNEGKSSSEQFYLAEGSADVSVDPIFVGARRVARALSNSDRIAFDYAERGTLVLRGDNGFLFAISGRKTV